MTADAPFLRMGRTTGLGFLCGLLTDIPFLPGQLDHFSCKTAKDLLFSLLLPSLPMTAVMFLAWPFCLAAVLQEARKAKRTSPATIPSLTRRQLLLSRLGIAVILAGILGIVVSFLAAPSLFAEADKSKSDMNFGYLLPFFIPAPVMLLLTPPILGILSWPQGKGS